MQRVPPKSRMATLIAALAPNEGLQPTAVPGVEVARTSESAERKPLVYEPMILFLGQGSKRAHLGDDVVAYGPDRYLALSVPIPVACEMFATPAEPLLALKLKVEPELLAELLINMDEPTHGNGTVPRGIYASPLGAELKDAVIRLLECLRSPLESRILGRQIVREIVFRVLRDEPGGALRALATRNDQFMRIVRVVQEMHRDFAEVVAIEDLAERANMSVSTFHQHFKAVTATSPLQYLKSIRLHQARLLMVHGSHNASTAALAVGYESASQFGREFKRMFGTSPAEEAAAIRARLASGVVAGGDRWIADAAG
ncbi:MAG: AraC family transcriptional regulator [Planctomycetes bacterium]|nr:AraC family transcriptional regulator [Planctomycetota bacterium]